MSALGHERRICEFCATSAFPPENRRETGFSDPLLGAQPDSCAAGLFDHLVGAGEQRRWYIEVERLRRLEIDVQGDFCRHLLVPILALDIDNEAVRHLGNGATVRPIAHGAGGAPGAPQPHA
jgi:hypothetical protein